MSQRNLVLFDLEWNIGYQPHTFNYHGVEQTLRGEIIEIGAVKIDEDGRVLDTFSIHLRPRIFRKLQHHIAKVTGLKQADLDRGEPIVQGLRRFMQWCGPDAEFAEWGMDDVPVLKQNLFLCNLDESRPTVWYDLQQIFLREHPRKEGEGMTLESVVTRLGLPMERPFHWTCAGGWRSTPPKKSPSARASARLPGITGISGCTPVMWNSMPGGPIPSCSARPARSAAQLLSRTMSGSRRGTIVGTPCPSAPTAKAVKPRPPRASLCGTNWPGGTACTGATPAVSRSRTVNF